MKYCHLCPLNFDQTKITLKVREMAAVTFGGFLHCGYMQVDQETVVR